MHIQATTLLVAGLTVAAMIAATYLHFRTRRQPRPPKHRHELNSKKPRTRQAAIIINPSKFPDTQRIHERITTICRHHGWADPLWYETTAADPGYGQTQQALHAAADLICPLGGDGTVRGVAQALAHTGTPMGLLPGGTGNLLARNLGLPLASIEDALTIALTGHNHAIDVGRISFDQPATHGAAQQQVGKHLGANQPSAQVFLVMAGIGFDAATVAGATEHLKARVGWLAYVVSAMQHLRTPRSRVKITTDNHPTAIRTVHSVLIGNCGQLAGGIVLMPDAAVDDGWLDAVTLAPTSIISWASVAARVLTRTSHDRVEHQRLRRIDVLVDRPIEGQLDGDPVGLVCGLHAQIDPGALIVRLPAANQLTNRHLTTDQNLTVAAGPTTAAPD